MASFSSSETSAYPTDFNHYLASRDEPHRTLECSALPFTHRRTDARPGWWRRARPGIPTSDASETTDRREAERADADKAPVPDELVENTPSLSPDGTTETPTPTCRQTPYVRGAGPQQTRHTRRQLGSPIAQGLGNSRGWVNAVRSVTHGALLAVSGGDGFAAFREYILADDADTDEHYRLGLAKPGTYDPKSQSEAYARDAEGWRASEEKEIANHNG